MSRQSTNSSFRAGDYIINFTTYFYGEEEDVETARQEVCIFDSSKPSCTIPWQGSLKEFFSKVIPVLSPPKEEVE